jgi:hypothetical protein
MNGAQKDWLRMFLVTPICLVIAAIALSDPRPDEAVRIEGRTDG